MTLYLGVDMGGTATRWAAIGTGGAVAARGEAPGASGLVFEPQGRAAFLAALGAIRAALPETPASAHLGITGAGHAPEAAIEDLAAEALGVPRARLSCLNDVVLAWHAAFEGAPGHLIAAGTGSVGVSVDGAGRVTMVGGRGVLIDDAGSGAWIALRALDLLCRRIDARGVPEGMEILARHLAAALGGPDWEAMRAYVYGQGRGRIGALAVSVAAAASEGDAAALGLMRAAGDELARLARALLGRAGPAPLAFVGGVLGLHPEIKSRLEAALPGERIAYPALDAALHGARMARQAATGAPA